MPNPQLRIEAHPLTAQASFPVNGLDAALPAHLRDRWNQHGEAQLATVHAVFAPGGALRAAALEVHRPMTAYVKVVDVWSPDPTDLTAEKTLLAGIEEQAWRTGAVVVKREFHGDHDNAGQAAWSRSLARGYRALPTPKYAGPLTGPHQAKTVRGQALWAPGFHPPRDVPYMRQTTDFTCGPVALHMALTDLSIAAAPSRAEELALWRLATTVGGCEPLGLALAAADRGATPAVHLSTTAPTLLELCTTAEERELRAFIQADFRSQVEEQQLALRAEAFTLETLSTAIRNGGLALVLIEQQGMHQDSCPHWIAAHTVLESKSGEIYLAHDPWTDAHLGETWIDGYHLPLPAASVDQLAWYGAPRYRGLLVVQRPEGRRSREACLP